MLHKMKLNKEPFDEMKNGTKTIEFRLYDEKRQKVKIGDKIEFSKLPELNENLVVDVLDLYREENFEKLFKKLGVRDEQAKNDSDKMHKIYSPKKERQYGVIGIKVKVIE